MADPVFDPNQPYEVIDEIEEKPASAVQESVSQREMTDEQYKEYLRLVRSKGTTVEGLSKWVLDSGFGDINNASEILSYARANPKSPLPRSVAVRSTPSNPLGDTLFERANNLTGGQLQRVDDTVRMIATGATGGVADKIAAFMSEGDYEENKDEEQALSAGAREREGVETPLGSIAPAELLGGALIPFGSGAKTVKELAKVGMGYGAVAGAGYSEGDTWGELAQDTAVGTIAGGIAGPTIGKPLNMLMSAVSKRAGGAVDDLVTPAAPDAATPSAAPKTPLPKGESYVDIPKKPGNKKGRAKVTVSEDGSIAEILLPGKNFSIKEVREVARELSEANPDIKTFRTDARSKAEGTVAWASSADDLHADVVTRLTKALKEADKTSKVNKEKLAEFRKQQAKALSDIRHRKDISGVEKHKLEMAALRGSAEKEGLDLTSKFTAEDIDELFNSIDSSPAFAKSLYGPLNAKVGLRKILEGETPTPSELDRLSQVFPADFIKEVTKAKGKNKLVANLLNLANLPRSMMATGDFSAPLRQGIFMVGRKEFYTALPTMFKEFKQGFLKNDKIPIPQRGANWQSSGSMILDEIKARPTYDDMEISKLAITNPYDHSLSGREEDFMSNLAEKFPVFGRVARGSNAAYAGFLNKLRADVFDSLTKDKGLSKEELAGVARYINSATGRGDLGSLNKYAPALNAALFSPRLIKSRLDLLNPVFYATLPPVAQKAALTDLIKFGGTALTVLTLASLGGADVETDARSSDFAKIRTGNTRLDVLGGFPQYVTLAARLASGTTKTAKGEIRELDGKGVNGTRLTTGLKFGWNKLAPVPSYVVTASHGKNPVGDPYDPVETTARMFIPLYIQGLEDVMTDSTTSDRTKAAVAIVSLFGVGAQSYDANKPRAAKEDSSSEEEAISEIPQEEYENLMADSEEVDISEEDLQEEPSDDIEEISADEYVQQLSKAGTTRANLEAKTILQEEFGFEVTDEGVRSREEQERYYRTTKGVSKPGTSTHEFGNAIDIKVPSGVSPAEVKATLEARGYYGVKIITQQHGTGPHWHIQWEEVTE